MNLFRIGIGGPKGSGKSYLANKIAQRINHSQVIPFALPLKKICDVSLLNEGLWQMYLATYGVKYEYPVELIPDIILAFRTYPSEPNIKNRPLLQFVGTEIFRAYDSDFWIKAADKEIKKDTAVVIHDDVRFGNETRKLDVMIEINGMVYTKEHPSESRAWFSERHPDYQIQVGFSDTDVNQLLMQFSFDFGKPI